MFDALLITEDPHLISEMQKITAVTGCSLEVNSKVNNSEIKAAHTVLIDASLNIVVNHSDVVIITTGEPGIEIWQKAVATGAKYVAFLPDAREWLLQNLIPKQNKTAQVIGVLGATGGLGTSLLASSVAFHYAEQNLTTALIESSSLTGGLDVLWGLEEKPGTRWPDLINQSNRILPQDIFRSLPTLSGVSILSCDSKDPRIPSTVIETIEGLTTVVDTVVIDLVDLNNFDFEMLLNICNELVLVAGSTIRSTSAANQILMQFPKMFDSKLVVRNLPGTSLDGLSIAKTLGLKLIGQLPTEPKITEHLEQGLSPAKLNSNSYRKSISEIAANLAGSNVSAVA